MRAICPTFRVSHPTSSFAFLFLVLLVGSFPNLVWSQDAFDFAHRVVPILKKHCIECHAGDQKKGSFSLNTRESLLAGGESGEAILNREKSSSELLRRVESNDPDVRMPPEGKGLNESELAILREWIKLELPWEQGFTFGSQGYDPPLLPRRPTLPEPQSPQRAHAIDRILDADRAKHGLTPIPSVDDAQLVRRLYLDLIGLLPTPEQTSEFVHDPSPDKRSRLIRSLLNQDVEYTEHWLTFWNDLFRNDYSGTGFITGGRTQISKWLYDSLVHNKPYDVMARELIAPPDKESAGFANGIRWRGEVSAGQTVEIQFSQSIGQAFLGINLKCASCHDSFIDRWKLQDAYGLAAVYSNTPLKIHRCDKPTGQVAKAGWLFPELGQVDADAPQPERLRQLANLMTHPQNGRFARTISNRLWHRLMGYGIVHPTDAMQSQPWNEDLLDYLAVELVDHRYDIKELLFLIASSEAYQAQPEQLQEKKTAETYVYHGPRSRRLTAEQFVDSVWQLTGSSPTKFDAPIIRGKPIQSGSESKPNPIKATGTWIWSPSSQSPKGAPAGEKVTFQHKFTIDQLPSRAFGVITVDNEYRLWINQNLIAEDGNWESLEEFDATPNLRVGENEILILATNGGSSPNPAALFFEMRLIDGDQTRSIASSTDWSTTSSVPDAKGNLPKKIKEWQNAVVAQGPWGNRLQKDIAQGLIGRELHRSMVRASLVKADPLMRSLGRPNRDQIVSMRPTELTTLEAMDLSNGATLAEWLQNGAIRWHKELASSGGKYPSNKELLNAIYQFAICRSPRPDEFKIIEEMTGPTLELSELEDILWAIVMLPEFQYVR